MNLIFINYELFVYIIYDCLYNLQIIVSNYSVFNTKLSTLNESLRFAYQQLQNEDVEDMSTEKLKGNLQQMKVS